jgi:signal transduction histidine kinase
LNGNIKKAEYYSNYVINHGRNPNTSQSFILCYKVLYECALKKNNSAAAVSYLNKYIQLRDSVINEKNLFELASIKTKYMLEKDRQDRDLIAAKNEAEQKALVSKQKNLKNIFIVSSVFFLVFVGFLVYANKLKNRKNQQLAQSLEKLKSTQEQLVHHEKLASMGKLSAGIAHEMRNPLNLVNNFSEVTAELLNEMDLTTNEEERTSIIKTMKENVSKITQHGRRAESIVKQIIAHVNTSSGTRQLCDINELCETYLKMVLHSMAMNKIIFNHQITKNYSYNIPPIAVNPQEIGRVLMNIYTNAFQAIEEKLLTETFLPEIQITTKYVKQSIFISITDNGIGIPKENIKKLGDPFFTTRPPNMGTGLGLNIAFDIIRSYGGRINATSEPGQFATILIEIPV